MVWCGVVWCGVVWCGVVWCGVVWCGVVWGWVNFCVCVSCVYGGGVTCAFFAFCEAHKRGNVKGAQRRKSPGGGKSV